jgi:anti-sigma-K factor RskA
MNETMHQEIIDLIPAYALGILEPDEAARVSNHLETCSSCQEELAAYEVVTDSLATAVPISTPPPALKDRLMSQTTATAVSPQPPQRESWADRLTAFLQGPRWRPVLAVAVLVLIIGALFFWWQNQNAPVAEFTLTPTETAPGAEGLISVAANGEATLTITNLPPLTSEEQYQLWLIQDGQRDSGAIFSVAADGSAEVTIDAKRPLTEYGAFGITIEPAGGSPGPTGDRVLGFNL